MLCCGLDLGRRSSRYCIVDDTRAVVHEGNVRTHKTGMRRVFSKREPMRIVVEASNRRRPPARLAASRILTAALASTVDACRLGSPAHHARTDGSAPAKPYA